MTKLTKCIGGLAGVTTISLLTETLQKLNGNSSQYHLMDGKKLKKLVLKACQGYKTIYWTCEWIAEQHRLPGIVIPWWKKNTTLRGGLLGTAAGLGSVLLNDNDKNGKTNGHQGDPHTVLQRDLVLSKVFEVSLYAIGGLIAGKVIEGSTKKKRKKK